MTSRKYAQLCDECVRCAGLQQRRAASFSAKSPASPIARSLGTEPERARPPSVPYGQTPPWGESVRPSSLRRSWQATSHPNERDPEDRERPSRDTGRSKQPPTLRTAKPAYVEVKESNKAPKQVNFSQGSALAAFLDRNVKSSSNSVDGSRQSRNDPRQPSHTSKSTPNSSPVLATKSIPKKSRRRLQPNKRIEISSVTSVATLAKLMTMKLRR